MVSTIAASTDTITPLDCACLIHGDAYSWQYVDTLYSMLTRNLSRPVRLHVYTEHEREVPAPYIKHALKDWRIGGPKKSWWYKMQVLNPKYHNAPLLYFDLDVVITRNIDWIWQLPLAHFWTVKDFKYLWRETHQGINSSIMWFDVNKYSWIWEKFRAENLNRNMSRFHGDQDYLTDALNHTKELPRFFDLDLVQSYRWQALDGGFNFAKRIYHRPNLGVELGPRTAVLIFHGKPKPGDVSDSVVKQYWQ
jgi:hypothetical protein